MSVPPATPLDDERPPSLAGHMWARFAVAGLLILLLSGAATATFALTKLNHIASEVFPRTSQLHVAKGVVQTSYSGEPQTFLIIGSDRRAGSKDAYDRNNAPHSDTLLLVHLDPAAGQISVLSVPRDLLATITTRSGQIYYPRKVNAAYTIGSAEGGTNRGAELATETIEHLLHIKVNGVIDVTFKGFRDVVDTLGCVYVNVDHRYFNEANGSVKPTTPRSICSPATRSSATKKRSAMCAIATATQTSCASPASRTSSATCASRCRRATSWARSTRSQRPLAKLSSPRFTPRPVS